MIRIYTSTIYICSLLSFFIILFLNKSFITPLPLLPLCYLLIILLFKNFIKKTLEYKSLFIINIIIIIRYLLIPVLYSIDSFTLFSNVPNYEVLNKSIALMIYELIITVVTIEIITKRKLNLYKGNLAKEYNVFGVIFLSFVFSIILFKPKVLERYSFILTADTLKSKYIEGFENSVFLLPVQLGYFVLIASIIHFSYKYYSEKNKFIGLIMSLIFSMFFSMFIVGTSRLSVIVPLITSLVVIGDIFSEYKRKIYLYSVFIVLFIIGLTSQLKSNTINIGIEYSFLENIHYQLQVYFSGFMNVGYALDTRSLYSSFQTSSIINDLLKSVAYVNKLFQSNISAIDAFNIRIYNGGLERDQILPMIGQGYLYFGFLLSPIFIVLNLCVIIFIEKWYSLSSSVMVKFVLMLCIVKLSLYQMSNMTILTSYFFNIIIPLLMIVSLNKLFGRKQEFEHK